MKKVFMVIASMLFIGSSLACDICGGAAGGFSLGIMPGSNRHFVGFRTTYRSFESYPAPDGHGYRGTSTQQFSTTELFGRYQIGRRFQVQAFIPFVVNQKTDSITTTIKGLGDVYAVGNVVFVNTMENENLDWKQSGTIGLGVKAPTGKYFKLGFDEVNMFPGSGSFDFFANFNYTLQYKKVGLQNETSFTNKLQNKYLFKFGNAFSTTQLVYYKWSINDNFVILPQVGVNYQYNWKDRKDGILSEDSFNGGSLLNGQINAYFLIKNWGVNAQFFLPLSQTLNSGLVHQKMMGRLSVYYFINSKK